MLKFVEVKNYIFPLAHYYVMIYAKKKFPAYWLKTMVSRNWHFMNVNVKHLKKGSFSTINYLCLQFMISSSYENIWKISNKTPLVKPFSVWNSCSKQPAFFSIKSRTLYLISSLVVSKNFRNRTALDDCFWIV